MAGHPNAPNNPQTFPVATGSYAIVVGKGGDAAHRNPVIAQGQNGTDSTITVWNDIGTGLYSHHGWYRTDFYDKDFKIVKTSKYINNTGYFFSSGEDTWHGLE